MPRYIDAYKLYSRLIDAKHLFCKNQLEFRALQPNDKARVDEIDNCIAMVINSSTADVVERKKGFWEWGEDEDYRCSNCQKYAYGCLGEVLSGHYKFCPYCGCAMEGEEDDEED